jgi:hypothetical protein
MNLSKSTVTGALFVPAILGLAAVAGCGSSSSKPLGSVADLDAGPGASAGDGSTTPSLGGGLLGDAGLAASLAFDPPSITLTVGNTPQIAKFTLKATLADGTVVAVAPQMAIFTRPDLAVLTMPAGIPVVLTASGQASGDGTLQGLYGGRVATAKLHVSVHLSNTGAGVDPSAPGAIDLATTPDPKLGALLYPYDKTVFPLGVTSPLVMWTAPNAGDVYRLRFEEAGYVCDDYEVITARDEMRIAQKCWDWLTSANQGDPIKATLSRWDAATKNAYVSAQDTWTLAHANMQGAVYYWSTLPNDTQDKDAHLSRIHPGTGAQPEVLLNGTCMACHAVSANGSTLVAVLGDNNFGAAVPSPMYPMENTANSPPGPCAGPNSVCQENTITDGRAWFSFDLPNVTLRHQSTMFGGNLAVTPDGKYTAFGDVQLFLADTASGALFTGTGLDNVVLDPGMDGLMMPTFSPDGKHFAAIEGVGLPNNEPSYISLTQGKLLLLDFDEGTRAFSQPRGLAPASAFPAAQSALAYPTFAPDGNWIAFHVGDSPTGCQNTCDGAERSVGAIYLQNTSGAPAVRLSALTDSSANAADHDVTFEPTFNPIQRGGYFWVVVSSERDWGNRIVGLPNNGKKRLWVAAIDAAPGAADPSHPAFFLEGQEEDRLNMRGFWALAACTPTRGGGGCTAGFQCCSGYCDSAQAGGMCVDLGKPICKAAGDTCTMTSDCCNAPIVQCVGGMCGARAQ